MNVFILNGPNLHALGKRDLSLYGSVSLKEIESYCLQHSQKLGFSLTFRQTNHEGLLIDWVHEAQEHSQGLIVNAGGLTHYSISLMDSLFCLSIPIVEVHLTNIFKRETFRSHSYISYTANGVIAGFGATSYILALDALDNLLNKK